MAQTKDIEKSHLYQRDLLQSFIFPSEEEEEGIELSLGLSMNGRFGVDPTAKKIKRTTSIPEFMNPSSSVMRRRREEEEVGYVVSMNCISNSNLIRTCSLPTETEDEWRRRKELQTLRRMEARRKRCEKQRNLKAMRERNEGNGVIIMEHGGDDEFNSLKRTTSLTARVGGLGLSNNREKENGGGLPPPSIGSSNRTTSSVVSEFESLQGQGIKPADARSPIGVNSCDDERKSPATTVRNLPNNHSSPENKTKDSVRNMLEDMPCVSTKGDGPNGKKVEGFLYRYGKGEEVRIVCVCHGSFLTPAEFVKHAGGRDVANPLKHIVVSPSLL